MAVQGKIGEPGNSAGDLQGLWLADDQCTWFTYPLKSTSHLHNHA